jgi:methyltransferase (TIGR00027 family)
LTGGPENNDLAKTFNLNNFSQCLRILVFRKQTLSMPTDTPSRTAEGIAAARARESARPEGERLFFDPFARHFLSRRIRFIARVPPLRALFRWHNRRILPGMFGGLVARTRYIDDYLLTCLKIGIKQVVILGAGYDARAYRFDEVQGQARVFEVDRPATQQAKKKKIERILGGLPDHVTFVPVCFHSENLGEKLLQKGYRTDLKTLFIWEGVTMYLSAEAVDITLAFIAGQSSPGSSVIFDYFPPSVVEGTCPYREAKALRKKVARYGEKMRFGIEPTAIEDFLAQRGFHRIRSIPAEECKSLYFRETYAHLPVSRLFHFAHAEVHGELPGMQITTRREIVK